METMTKKQEQEKEKQEARAFLEKFVKEGTTVYTILRHVSGSGMMRIIDMCVVDPKDGEIISIGWQAAKLMGSTFVNDKHYGVKVGGCGMDMGYHLVHNLGYALFKDGFECTSVGCPSNDHANGDRNYKPHHHKSGGYALKHRWL